MNSEKRPIIYKKVKQFSSNTKKNLRFNLNPQLDREECMKEDLAFLKQIQFNPIIPGESDVCCENYHDDDIQVTTLTEAEIWEFVFSDEWKNYSSIRICEGQLLDTVLQYLFSFVEQKLCKTYKMSKFDTITRVVQPKSILKKSSKDISRDYNTEQISVKIKFTYYSANPQIGVESEFTSSNYSQLSEIIQHQEIDGLMLNEGKSVTLSVHSTKSFSTVSECGDSLNSVSAPASDVSALSVKEQNKLMTPSGEMPGSSDVSVKIHSASLSGEETSKKASSNFELEDDDASSESPLLDIVSSTGFLTDSKVSITNNTISDVRGQLKGVTSVTELKLDSTDSQSLLRGKSATPTPAFLKNEGINNYTLSLPDKIAGVGENQSNSITNTFKAERISISAPVWDYVQFETDYDKLLAKSSHISKQSEILEINPTISHSNSNAKKESRIYLTDPEEHFIGSDDDLLEKTNIPYALERRGQSEFKIPEVNISAEHKVVEISREKIPKIVSFSPIEHVEEVVLHEPILEGSRRFTKECTNMRCVKIKSRKGILKNKALNIPELQKIETTEAVQTGTVYLKIIENLKNKRLGKQHNRLPEGSDIDDDDDDSLFHEAHNNFTTDTDKFGNLVPNYSIKLFKTINNIGTTKLIPITKQKQDVLSMIENFLEEKYAPKLSTIPENNESKNIQLNPLPFSADTYTTNLPQIHCSNSEQIRNFEQKIPSDFKEQLMKACEDYIVRKEQVTFSNNWQTVTYVTINRKFPGTE